MNTTQAPRVQDRTKYRQNKFKTQNPSFPYLERASKRVRQQTTEHNSSRNKLMSWKIAEDNKNEVIEMRLRGNTKIRLEEN